MAKALKLIAIGALLSTWTSAAAVARHVDGEVGDGATWAADVPDAWNGTLVLFSRGGGPKRADPVQLAPRDAGPALLARGYAIAGTSFAADGWNPRGGAATQLAAVPRIAAAIGAPRQVINLGQSYGGGVSAQEAERTKGEIAGSVITCGLVVGGLDLMNAQLDGMHAVATLLAPAPVRLVGLHDAAGVAASADALTAAVAAALATPAGRARVALAAALMHLPTWHDGAAPPADDAAKAAQQAKWLLPDPQIRSAGFTFMQGSRLDIETVAGGNPSGNAGVDYAALLADNAGRALVAALYRAAGLDLAADLGRLTRAAATRTNPAAVAWLRDTSLPTGAIRVPVLAMQTTADPVAPPEFLTLYATRVGAVGNAADLRTVAVARPGHCGFAPAEIVAAVDAMAARLASGAWGDVATPAALAAASGGAPFVADPHRPFASRVAIR